MCIEQKIEIIEVDDRFLFGKNTKAILVDKKINVLTYSQRQREDSQTRRNQYLTLRMFLLSRSSKS